MTNLYNQKNPLKIAVLPGDGIGKEVVEAALPIFNCLEIPTLIHFGEIGWECWKKEGDPIPKKTWDLIEWADTILLGAITSKPLLEAEMELLKHLQGKGIEYVSPVIQLRQKLGLFANVRPIYNVLGQGMPYRFTIIRENTEGLYAGLDFASAPSEIFDILKNKQASHVNWQIENPDQASCAIRLQTDLGLKRLFKFSFQYAKNRGFKKLTLADKPNVLRYSGNFARARLQEIAKDFPDIVYDIQNVDAVALQMVKKPEQYGVIVAENMFGDILSDLGAGIMGGLGLAPSANIGEKKSYFEPVHGSAPVHAGLNKANPAALFLTIALMLEHLGYSESAKKIEAAIENALTYNESITYDLSGKGSTRDFAEKVISQFKNPAPQKKVSFLSVGTELSQGKVLNTTSYHMASALSKNGIAIRQHMTVPDDEVILKKAIRQLLKRNETLIITGGLGPTDDDKTRFSLSEALNCPLKFNTDVWENIQNRLRRFKLNVSESNRRQAFFPKNAYCIPNPNGTAAGFWLEKDGQTVFVLPGPPSECLPMFNQEVLPKLLESGYGRSEKRYFWKLLGAIESEIGEKINSHVNVLPIEVEYCWNYPYLNITLLIKSECVDEHINQFIKNLDQEFAPYLISNDENQDAITLAVQQILKNGVPLIIYDAATRGVLESNLRVPATDTYVSFLIHPPQEIRPDALLVKVEGLEEYWLAKPYTGTTSIRCHIAYQGHNIRFTTCVPYRSSKMRDYAAAYICQCILFYYQKKGFQNVRVNP